MRHHAFDSGSINADCSPSSVLRSPSPTTGEKGNVAFTLAEVLITLGIIGVVAALTIPTLIANHKKQVVVTRMEKFYSTINQAVKRSTVDNEDASAWQGTNELDADSMLAWWQKYMSDYFLSKDIKQVNDGITVALNDGSGFGVYNPCVTNVDGISCMHIVYCVNYDDCKNHLDKSGGKLYNYPLDGKNTFLFIGHKNGIITYGSGLDRDDLMNISIGGNYGCAMSYKAYCAALIESDGWEIEKDYPIRF